MKFDRFEDIIAWQKGRKLVVVIYSTFKYNRDYGFKDQVQRAAISICNNIAEGFERRSDKEFKQFLFIAKGSCGELRSMIYSAQDLKYITTEEFCSLADLSEEVSRLISGIIKTL